MRIFGRPLQTAMSYLCALCQLLPLLMLMMIMMMIIATEKLFFGCYAIKLMMINS